jgi:hypothetical protein
MIPEVAQILAYENPRKADLQAYLGTIPGLQAAKVADLQAQIEAQPEFFANLAEWTRQRVVEVEQHIAWLGQTFPE